MLNSIKSNYFNPKLVASYDYCDYMVDLDKNLVFINFTKDVSFDLKMGKELYYKSLEYFPSQKTYVIINITQGTQVDVGVLDFIASDERLLTVHSDAFIISSLTLKIVANFYLKIKNPKIKTKLFFNIEDAFDWTAEQHSNLI